MIKWLELESALKTQYFFCSGALFSPIPFNSLKKRHYVHFQRANGADVDVRRHLQDDLLLLARHTAAVLHLRRPAGLNRPGDPRAGKIYHFLCSAHQCRIMLCGRDLVEFWQKWLTNWSSWWINPITQVRELKEHLVHIITNFIFDQYQSTSSLNNVNGPLTSFFHRSGCTGTRRTGGGIPSLRKRPSATASPNAKGCWFCSDT